MSKIILKTFDDLAKIKQAIAIWKEVKKELINQTKVGVSLNQLDEIAKQKILALNAVPTFYKMYGFPKNICISVNECVIHGVPNDYIITEGDKVTFDVGVTYQNRICDAAFTVIVGQNPIAQKMSEVALNAIYEAQKVIKPGVTNAYVSQVIENYIKKHHYYPLEDFTGHGCGNELHEEPIMSNYYSPFFETVKLKENMVLCIEPMLLSSNKGYFINPKNHWDVIANDKGMTAHWEHMLLVTKDGCIILTE